MGARKRPQNDAKTAIAYLRVSTDRQEHGPEAQRAAVAAWAEREGVQIVEWFSEEDVSGADEIADRPELQRALAAVRTRRAGMLLAAKRDRLAREVAIAREIGVQARANGGFVVTADGMSDVEGRPDTFLKQGISDLFAEHERLQIVDRTVAALGVMRRKGYRTGTAPFGFRPARKGPPSKRSGKPLPLELEPREQEICAYVMRRVAEGWSTRRIERDLRDRGVVNRVGRPLVKTQVQRIIASCEALRALFPEHARSPGDQTIPERSLPARDFARTPIYETENAPPATYEGYRRQPLQPDRVLACGRGHVFEDPAREGSYCCRDECAAERGTYKPERRVEWRYLSPAASESASTKM